MCMPTYEYACVWAPVCAYVCVCALAWGCVHVQTSEGHGRVGLPEVDS